MKKFSMFFGRLPLCGKYGLRDWIASVICSQSKEERTRCFILCMVSLLSFIVFHAGQVYGGCRLFCSSTSVGFMVVGAVYALINLGACFEQVYLAYRVVVFVIRRRGKYCQSEHNHSLNRDSGKQQLIAIATTLAGQAIFAIVYAIQGLW